MPILDPLPVRPFAIYLRMQQEEQWVSGRAIGVVEVSGTTGPAVPSIMRFFLDIIAERVDHKTGSDGPVACPVHQGRIDGMVEGFHRAGWIPRVVIRVPPQLASAERQVGIPAI